MLKIENDAHIFSFISLSVELKVKNNGNQPKMKNKYKPNLNSTKIIEKIL